MTQARRAIKILICSLFVAVASYAIFFLLPPVAEPQDNSELSPRHQELLIKDVLTPGEAAELMEFATSSEPMDVREAHATLRKNALIISWIPWLVFAFVYPHLTYKELLLWIPALSVFWLADLFLATELGLFLVAGVGGIAARWLLSRGKGSNKPFQPTL